MGQCHVYRTNLAFPALLLRAGLLLRQYWYVYFACDRGINMGVTSLE